MLHHLLLLSHRICRAWLLRQEKPQVTGKTLYGREQGWEVKIISCSRSRTRSIGGLQQRWHQCGSRASLALDGADSIAGSVASLASFGQQYWQGMAIRQKLVLGAKVPLSVHVRHQQDDRHHSCRSRRRVLASKLYHNYEN